MLLSQIKTVLQAVGLQQHTTGLDIVRAIARQDQGLDSNEAIPYITVVNDLIQEGLVIKKDGYFQLVDQGVFGFHNHADVIVQSLVMVGERDNVSYSSHTCCGLEDAKTLLRQLLIAIALAENSVNGQPSQPLADLSPPIRFNS